MDGIGGGADAEQPRAHAGPAAPGVLGFFDDHDRRAFAEDEPATARIERSRDVRGRAEAVEARDHEAAEEVRPPREDDVRPPGADPVRRERERMRARRARELRRRDGTATSRGTREPDRGGVVRDTVHPVRRRLAPQTSGDPALEDSHAAEGRADGDADPARLDVRAV